MINTIDASKAYYAQPKNVPMKLRQVPPIPKKPPDKDQPVPIEIDERASLGMDPTDTITALFTQKAPITKPTVGSMHREML